MNEQKPNIIRRHGIDYIVLRTKKTNYGFIEHLVRQVTSGGITELVYLVDYRK